MTSLLCQCGTNSKNKKAYEPNFVFVGLENTGKSSIIKYLTLDDPDTVPIKKMAKTFGFNQRCFKYEGRKVILSDCGGQREFRNLWEYYYEDVNGIVFVIDASNMDKLEESGSEIINILNN